MSGLSEKKEEVLQPSKRDKDPFPPKLLWWQWIILVISYLLGFCSALYLVDQFCALWNWPSSICFSYIAFGVLIAVLIIDRIIRRKILVHKARLVDQSLVEAMMIEAATVEPRKYGSIIKPDGYKDKVDNLNYEVKRLKDEGNRYWTEYQILSLNQMLVDFLSVDDLISSVRLSLAELEEYAEDSAYPYDRDRYYGRKQLIDEAIKKINKVEDSSAEDKDLTRENASVHLRAEFRTLLEHVADYNQNWSTGSLLVRSLTVLGVLSIPMLLAMGLLPVLHPSGDKIILGYFNWGLLGISGAITAILLSLRKTDEVEVGNTEGRKELRNAMLGTALGLVAGMLAYAMISGGLVREGLIIPHIGSKAPEDIGLSTVWAIASGFCFEKVFDRIRSTTFGGT